MLEMAERAYRDFQKNDAHDGSTLKNMSHNKRIGDHGPRHMELFKLGLVMYQVTGKKKYLDASVNANRKIVRDHMLIDGVPSTTEHMRGISAMGMQALALYRNFELFDHLPALGWLCSATTATSWRQSWVRSWSSMINGGMV